MSELFSIFQLILVSVLNCLYDSISHMLRKNVEKKAMLENLDGVFLAIDEICDSGLVTTNEQGALILSL